MVLQGQTAVSEDAQNKKELAGKTAGAGASPETPETPDPLRGILQGFAGDTRTVMTNLMYSGNAEGVQRNSNAQNTDSGMGGSAGKEDEAKKRAAYDDMMRQTLANWDNWKADYDNTTDPYDKFRKAQDKFKELTRDYEKDAEGNIKWDVVARKEGVLNEDVLARRPGESEQDYQDRILNALKKEMLDENGQIRDKYRNSPLARVLFLEKEIKTHKPAAEAKAQSIVTESRAEIAILDGKQDRLSQLRLALDSIEAIQGARQQNTALNELLLRNQRTAEEFDSNKDGITTVAEVRDGIKIEEQKIEESRAKAGEAIEEVQSTFGTTEFKPQNAGLASLKAEIGVSPVQTASAAPLEMDRANVFAQFKTAATGEAPATPTPPNAEEPAPTKLAMTTNFSFDKLAT